MQLEAAPHELHSVRQERRGEGIAGMAAQGAAVELERQALRSIDADACGCWKTRGCHVGRGPVMAYTDSISWVTVLRTRLNHWPQPCAWRQRSKCKPLGLSRKNKYSPQAWSLCSNPGRVRCDVPPHANSLSSRRPQWIQGICIISVQFPMPRLRRSDGR